MAFDPSTAKPVSQGFDVSSAQPVQQQTIETLSPQAQQLPFEQQQQLETARRAQVEAVGAPEIAQQPTASTRGAQAIERMRATAPKNTLFARDLPEIGEAPELREFDVDSAKRGFAAGLINNEAELANAIAELTPGAEVQQDPEGRALVKFPSGNTFAVNKPGLSGQDFVQFTTRLLSFLPAGRVTGTGLRAATKGAAAGAGTEATLQTAEAGLGGEFNPEQVAVAGAAQAVGQQVGERIASGAQKLLTSSKEIGSKKLLEQAAPSVDTLKNSARAIYNQIDESGAQIKPTLFRGLVKKIELTLRREGLDATESITDSGTPKALALLNRLKREDPNNMTISQLDTLRKAAKGVADSKDKAESALGVAVINRIDDVMEGLGPNAFKRSDNISIQGKSVGEAFKDARNFWGRARRAERIELAIDLAENSPSGVEKGLRNEFNSLARQIKKGTVKGFTKEEEKAINAVAQGDSFRNAVTQLGKLGIPEDQATNTLMLSLVGGFGATQFGSGPGGALATGAAIAVPTLLRRQARILTENSAKLASAITRSKGNALQIARAYVRNTPKNKRDPAELAGILLNNADEIPASSVDNTFIDNALFVARAASTAEATGE